VQPIPESQVVLPWSERVLDWLQSTSAASCATSLVIHLLLLIGMAFWILPHIREITAITTVVQGEEVLTEPFDEMNDVVLETPAGSEDVVLPQMAEAIEADSALNVLEHQFLRDVTAADTQGEGAGSGAGAGGFRLLEPRNAIRAGSFTAWTIPIPQRVSEKPEPGASPRPGQDYHIVIQVKISDTRKSYSIADLSGKVVGTDGYVQLIPAQAFVQDDDGRLIRARQGRPLRVLDGVVQILIRVPGAEALVKDTINIKSKLLKESQTLNLIFGRRD
jgi:hypothetical protein